MTAQRRGGLLAVNEIALWLVTVAALVGMHRLFEDGSYWWPVVLQAIAAHLTVAVLRRAGLPTLPAALVTAALAVLVISWTRFPETTAWLLPTGDTFSVLGDDISTAWTLFGDVRAPAPVENGFIATTAGAVWVLAFVADWAAFRLAATFEALLPAATLFVFAAALGGAGSPVASAAVFSAAALLYVLLHRTAHQESTTRWAGGHRVHGRWSLVSTGATIVGVAVVAGTVAGPNLPGADAEAVVAWRDLNKDEPTRVVLSPIVQLETQLVDQPDIEVFNVRSDQPSYWRLTSLDSFDGEIWRSSYSTDDAVGDLPRSFDAAVESRTVTQTITIEALGSVWLPAAYEPVAVDTGDDQPTDFDPRSSTLMVDREVDSSDGFTYEVTSQLPNWSDDELRTASPEVPDDIADTYLPLPDDFPAEVEDAARRIVRDAGTTYDMARALQDHLRTFTYDATVGPGHGENALVEFLFQTQRGYCEQFSASFAAMARAVGLPSRVAIGFTSGVQDPNDPTLYRVRGGHAHAWPEVFLGEYGWVPFEPTPGRGPPGAGDWLGIAPDQDTSNGGSPDPGRDDPAGRSDGGVPAGPGSADGQRRPQGELGDGALAGPPPTTPDSPTVPEPIRDAAPPLGGMLLAYIVLVPLAIVAQQVVRRRRARSVEARIRYAWRSNVEQAIAADVPLPDHLTIAEMADVLATEVPAAADDIQRLARTMEAIAYADALPSADDLENAERAWAAIITEVRHRRSWLRRALSYFDIRRLSGTRRERRIAHQGEVVSRPV
ncbi:MAG: DUF3488 domain-containing protein [Acidimicrobiales bacterium]|nr:DUF3488 domain-containing protein [Acidimicrobiales bacterium]